jgi:hypothetical protein
MLFISKLHKRVSVRMLNIPHRMQSSPSKASNRLYNGHSSGVRFGLLTEEQLNRYQHVLKDMKFLKQCPNNISLVHDTWLSERAKVQLEQDCKQIDPPHLKAMYRQGLLGPLNKASSLLFELYALTALRQDVITLEMVRSLKNSCMPDKKGGVEKKPFEQLLKEVGNHLPEDKLEFFHQHIVGGPLDKAKDLMSLMMIRYMMMPNVKRKATLESDAKRRMRQQASSLDDTLPLYSPRRLQVWGLTAIYTTLSFLPVEWFRTQMKALVKSQLGVQQIEYEDMIKNLHKNQIRFQEVQYEHPNKQEAQLQKRLGGLDVITEADVVRDAVLGHPSEISFRA